MALILPTPIPKAALVKSGEEYLPGVQLSELEETYRRERPGKSRDRLQPPCWNGAA